MRNALPRAAFGPNDMPLDAARAAFEWLLTGSQPLSVDGRTLPGLPDHDVPLDQVRHHLLQRSCPQPVRDAVWAHLVRRSRDAGPSWTVGCVGVAMPALTGIAARLTRRFVGDPRDIHSAVLSGFLAELATIDVTRPRIMLRLRWAAYRAGLACVREALDAPTPSAHAFHASAPQPPAGHPDLVLLQAVAAGVITPSEADLIATTRLEDVPLVEAAARRASSYEATKKARQRAEHRLAHHLHSLLGVAPHGDAPPGDISATTTPSPPRTTITGSATRRRVRRRVSPSPARDGVQMRGPDQHGRARAEPPTDPTARPTGRPSETPEVPRCA